VVTLNRFGKKIFMPFVVLGDPNYEESIKIIKKLIDGGAGALELGFAFSDPIADGPVIQKADLRALKEGANTNRNFQIINEVRKYSNIPISIMLSYNLAYKYGLEEFYKKCAEEKIDAVLFPDVPLEESKEAVTLSKKYKLNQIFLVSPTTTLARLKEIKKVCTGYVYLVSILGTTGTRDTMNTHLKELINKTKKEIKLPIYVGFGISKPEHVKEVLKIGASGAISGSAICKIIEENQGHEKIAAFCKEMSKAAKEA
jgi:tryptophan synthase alpha chain